MNFKGFGQARNAAFRRRAMPATAFSVALAVIGAGIFLHPGTDTADVDLNDGGIWVTNKSQSLVGHLNYQSQLLDGGFKPASASFDVQQEAATVLLQNVDQNAVSTVSVAEMIHGAENQLPGSAKFSLGTGVAAVSDPASGQVWAVAANGLDSFTPEATQPLAEDAPGAIAVVSNSDTVYVADPEAGRLTGYRAPEGGLFEEVSAQDLPGIKGAEGLQLTTVGDEPVLLDPAGGTLYLPSGKTVLLEDAQDARLQQPGDVSERVAIATANGLLAPPLDGGEAQLTEIQNPAPPIAPVQVAGCIHAAWTGDAGYLRDCADDAFDLSQPIPSLSAQSELVFRTNRDVVVLNDVNAGNVWLVNKNLQLVNNWGDLIPPKGDDEDDTTESADITAATRLPERQEENQAPVAVADEFGVRAGRTTVLPVLFNDSDPDGDLLTVTINGDQPATGTVQRIYQGTGLQIVLPEEASGSSSFSYEVNDGRGGTDTAQVRLRVVPQGSNAAPEQKRETILAVESGQSLSRNVLTDWLDPDGDDLLLMGAVAEDPGDIVRTRPDGVLTYQDVGTSDGEKKVTITVSDGRTSTTGEVTVEVEPRGELAPVTNPDHVRTTVGEDVTIFPLRNDADPTGGSMRLASVGEVPNAAVQGNYDVGTVTFSSAAAGTYYLEYLATTGPTSSPGLIRVDVTEAEQGSGVPTAVRDVVLLPSRGESLVDVLANDSDPAGGVLVVQSVSVPRGAPVDVAVLNHSILRVNDARGLGSPLTITYTASNGSGSATGEVAIFPVPAPAKLLPPRANNDEAVVRAGDIVNIPVLENDEHPNGAALTLDTELVEAPAAADGTIAISGNQLRFKAGPEANGGKTVTAVYRISGPDGQVASAQLRIRITGPDAENNARPVPKNLTARVLAGKTVSIPVPLDGIDPDGDSVSLAGLERAPTLGTAMIKAAAIEYTAGSGSTGTDTISYVVQDRLGARSTATISIGIAPSSDANQPPNAVDDEASVRPGRNLSVDVLKNDSDPDGDRIAFTADGLSSDADLQLSLREGRVRIAAPETEGTAVVRYTITDGRGGTSTGTLTVKVDPDAPLLPPVARDDRVAVAETTGRDQVSVPLLNNDEDPDGDLSELAISIDDPAGGATVAEDRTLTVPVRADTQIIAYTLEDVDSLTSTAFIVVPGNGDQRPALKEQQPLEVRSGEPLALDIGQLVAVREGRTPRLTQDDKVAAVAGSARIDGATGLTFTSNDGYAGAASVSFEVTDGSGPDDPDGLKATLTVPITVLPLPEQNAPPTLSANSLLVAQAGEPATLDLREAASDPDPQDADALEFAVTGGSVDGVDVSIDGSVLTARAKSNAAKGTEGTINVSVTDGNHDPVSSTVTISVVATDRPPAVAVDDLVPDAHQGETVTVPVLDNDSNPFPETPLKILSAQPQDGGQGSVAVSGDTLAITPDEDFVGTMGVIYRIQDATEDPDRETEGSVTLTVKGKPDAPSTPRMVSEGNQTAVLTWEVPADNGERITSYTVSGGGFSQECAANTCTLENLTNNQEYNFTVTATNAVGTSEPSPASGVVRPDVKPETPAAPQLVFGDGALTVTWQTPASQGSPVESFNLEISPAPPVGELQKNGVTGNSLVWNGLANGTAYKVRVQANNRASTPSDWGAYSAEEIPAGVPGAPSTPTATRTTSAVNEGSIDVAWTAPANTNGAPVEAYDLRIFENGALADTRNGLSAATTGLSLTGLKTASSYTFDVVAHNKAGAGERSGRSAAVVPYGVPHQVQGVSAAATGANEQVKLDFAAPYNNGSAITGYEYAIDGGGWRAFGGPGATVSSPTNGQNHTWKVRALNAGGPGAASPASNATSAYGPITDASNLAASTAGPKVTFTWNANWQAYGNGREITGSSVTVNGQAVNAGAGSWTSPEEPNKSYTITVTVSRSDGSRSFSRTQVVPPAEITGIYRGDRVNVDGTSGWHYVIVDYRNFPQGTRDVWCRANGSNLDPNYGRAPIGFAHSGRVQTKCIAKIDSPEPGAITMSVEGMGDFAFSNWSG
ncbi:Ig-like domain-containing protein [Arthrobacter crystallopoietes]|uniref:Ig-like domain-containing protein n=1 Tax=Crystallibacter crystallopoietes TaxID=37928 RepID=UPI001FC8FD10|nr:Ig-like domain-containing protein [Arthrobacter crystallopoietes]